MSEWTHAICEPCWHLKCPGREPVRLTSPDVEICCWCGNATVRGIYFREDPAKLACKGNHESSDLLKEGPDGT